MAKALVTVKSGSLHVTGMKFFAYHGCLPEETKIGSEYEVDIIIESDFSSAASTDNLNDTYDYTEIYNTVKKEMGTTSKLIEHVAVRIAKSLISKLSEMQKLSVSVVKINPPVNGNIKNSKIKLDYIFDNK